MLKLMAFIGLLIMNVLIIALLELLFISTSNSDSIEKISFKYSYIVFILSSYLFYLFDLTYPYFEHYGNGNLELFTDKVLGLQFHFNLDEISIRLYVLSSFLPFYYMLFNLGKQYEQGDMILLFLIHILLFCILFDFGIKFE